MEHDLLDELLDKSPRSIFDLEDMPVGSMLIVIGAYISMVLGFFHFLINSLVYSPPSFIFQFIISFFLGLAMLVAYVKYSRDVTTYAISTMLFSIILILLGGAVGAIAGLIALMGSVITLFTGDR